MRTIKCTNPVCKVQIPLTANWWLTKKTNKRIALFPFIKDKSIQFKIVGDGFDIIPKDFNPEKGTISIAITTCPNCSTVINADVLKECFRNKSSGERLIAVIEHDINKSGKIYRLANKLDEEKFVSSLKYFEEKRKALSDIFGFDPVPDGNYSNS